MLIRNVGNNNFIGYIQTQQALSWIEISSLVKPYQILQTKIPVENWQVSIVSKFLQIPFHVFLCCFLRDAFYILLYNSHVFPFWHVTCLSTPPSPPEVVEGVMGRYPSSSRSPARSYRDTALKLVLCWSGTKFPWHLEPLRCIEYIVDSCETCVGPLKKHL